MAGLDAGFFIGKNNKIIATQWLAFPDTMIQINNNRGFLFKIGISGPDPATVAPWPNGILAQPTPDCFSAYGSNNPLFLSLLLMGT
jgi:hypothetical protein